MGGNCLNAAVVLARQGVEVKLITKFAKDYLASQIIDCLKTEHIDTNSIVYVNKPGMTTGFSYIIIDESTLTRTVIHNPCEDLLDPSELPDFDSLLNNIDLLILDGKHSNVSFRVIQKIFPLFIFSSPNLPILKEFPYSWMARKSVPGELILVKLFLVPIT
jgi:sugar/nucleoside kinase (ribokinase family)